MKNGVSRPVQVSALVCLVASAGGAQVEGAERRATVAHLVSVRVPAIAGVLGSSPAIRVADPAGRSATMGGTVAVQVASNVPAELRVRADRPAGTSSPGLTVALPGREPVQLREREWTTLPGVLAAGIGDHVVTVRAHDPTITARDLATLRLVFDVSPVAGTRPSGDVQDVAEDASISPPGRP